MIRYGTNLRDVIFATAEGDNIYALGGDDTIVGGNGNDWIMGGAGADTILGGGGFDGADYSDSGSGIIIAVGGYGAGGTAQGDFVASDIETIWASEYNDVLLGDAGANNLYGNGGNDMLLGGDGDDWIEGGTGDDLIEGGNGADYMSGGGGIDTVSYAGHFSASQQGIYVEIGGLTDSGATGDMVTADVENLVGSSYHDTLIGNAGNNRLEGGAGIDQIFGGAGQDVIVGGADDDYLSGGSGIDTVSYFNSAAGVVVDLRGGSAGAGDAEGDYLLPDFENFQGSAFRDMVQGNNSNNYLTMNGGDDYASGGTGDDNLFGGEGHDFLMGDANDDQLYGDGGHDTLLGGSGKDRLGGGDGNDKLTGGTNADTFVFDNTTLGDVDTIVDFRRSEGDKIRMSGVDANANLAGHQDFVFIGTGAFTGQAGQLHYSSNGLETLLTGDINGDAVADFTIKLTDAPGLISSDFIF
jgi:Ca2+-binding RTX toxin-like protein